MDSIYEYRNRQIHVELLENLKIRVRYVKKKRAKECENMRKTRALHIPSRLPGRGRNLSKMGELPADIGNKHADDVCLTTHDACSQTRASPHVSDCMCHMK